MNKEDIEVLTALGDLTNGALNYYKTSKSILLKDEIVRRYLEKIQQENQQLKDRINKAIEELNNGDYCECDFESMKFQNDIIKILKGGENND